MPVTTVPKPFIENARSIGSRAAPSTGRSADARGLIARSPSRSASRPSPVVADTSITGAGSRNDPLTSSRTSCRTSARVSSSARSDLVSTTMPRGMRSRRQMSKCSRVCGITDSSAATISSTQSMPPTPASIVRTNRSWPGTSTNATRVVADRGVREAQLDGDAARFLFLEAIGIDAGQRLDERALAVIDVAGGADDDVCMRLSCRFASFALVLAEPLLCACGAAPACPCAAPSSAAPSCATAPRDRSSRRTFSSTSSRPRSICRRSMSTRMICTVTWSPSR